MYALAVSWTALIPAASDIRRADLLVYPQRVGRGRSAADQFTFFVCGRDGGVARKWRFKRLWLLGLVLACSQSLQAQQAARRSSGPDSPTPQQQASPSPTTNTATRFIAYATNRSLIFPDIATSPGPITTSGKFKLFVNQSISPPFVAAAALTAAAGQARNIPVGYGQGWDAYGSRFGADMARASSNSFFGTFLFAALLHQDPRFFPESNPTWWRTVRYSAQLMVVTRNDSGNGVFNSSGLLGPLASEGLANVYLPSSEQTFAKTATRFGIDLAWKFAGNMFKNYWPSIFHEMGLNRLKVIPDPGTPARFKQEH
ncbi:MAG TPA: hypothetical protein VMT53_14845 [Terriglobales bacterium]|nr:hypothetical protein [Terriglobales bacterium]